MNSKRQQRGMTFIGVVFFGAIIVCVGIILAKVTPTYVEYLNIEKAVQKASAESTVAEVRASFDRLAVTGYLESVTGKDLIVEKKNDKVVVKFDYIREFQLVGPAWLVMKYEGQSE